MFMTYYVILYYLYIFKDAHTINYGHMQFKRTNITTVKLIDPTSLEVTSIMTDLKFVQQRMDLNMEVFQAENITVITCYTHFY